VDGSESTTKPEEMGWVDDVTFNDDGTWSFVSTDNGVTQSGSGRYSEDGQIIEIDGGDTMSYLRDGKTMTWSGEVDGHPYRIVWSLN